MNRQSADPIPHRSWVSSVVSALATLGAMGLATAERNDAHAITVSFRQNVAGYTQGADTFIWLQNPALAFGANPSLAVDSAGEANEAQSLFQFDGIIGNGAGQIPAGSLITSATLNLFNSSVSAPATGSLHRMLIPWTDATATWNSFSGGLNNVPAGEYEPIPSYSGAMGGGSFDATSIVQAWALGASNYGMAFLPTDVGGVVIYSNEADAILRPLLTVDYTTIPEPAELCLAATCAAGMLHRRRRSK